MRKYQYYTHHRLVLILLGLGLCLLRIPFPHFIENSLWAEDGVLFYNWAINRSAESLITPYAGYLNTYPRIIAFIATAFDFSILPYIFFTGWLIACTSLIILIVNRCVYHGYHPAATIIILSVIFLQPNSGEIFYSLTNSQWFTCIGMTLWCLDPVKKTRSSAEIFLFILAALTGPFIVLLAPVVILNGMSKRNIIAERRFYLAVMLCAILQAMCLVLSQRKRPEEATTDITAWIHAAVNFFSFGEYGNCNPLALVTLIFWAACIYILLKNLKTQSQNSFLIAIMGLLFFGAGLLANKDNPLGIHPLGNGARYYFPAYSLILYAAIMSQKARLYSQLFILCIPLLVSVHQFTKLSRSNLQWPAYAAFAKRIQYLSIPTNPQDPSYPGWAFSYPARFVNSGETLPIIEIPLTMLKFHNTISEENFSYRPVTGKPSIFLSIPEACNAKKTIGLVLLINRELSGWAKIYWGSNQNFDEKKSLARYFRAGDENMFFTFMSHGARYIRIDPQFSQTPFKIIQVNIYCID